ncbi:protein of unknown function [Candidatus Promineifilum breve]|uniref:SpoVT-AbrB domain-containing protein n=1 Tax=Candidatus Promineifilum breve TaxID=1806508 RepID=A0A170PH59_9CHLR|nr:AbrB/MazE/SpoVT family DNA-binding domain-containing protein [Candidatus Promineifilum breve]CUS04137.2 protein of unknown function [Candidatus Promineifilum breve]
MTLVILSNNENTISLPADLLERLMLHEGDQVTAILEGQTLRLAKLDKFLGLRGALAEDSAFDEAVDLLERSWESWNLPASASTPMF